ncbi:MAG: LysR substrate-binding domain-containing protein [Bacteroidetes bacterium]|nr:LysR substrate-binding domain-containing protein [Rhodothermia bacterium]MCS7156018.1 LysR substrate-binding domain-containing protein [Bacteroidota bacterium]MCX7907706.1 LysR substrate-binding domain-containing protein [Bacteroidota bacterium]MDW8137835.1 LysR substrate-binding domain-containing protein [Bacteroidota bacterium]MDW8286314.1 LysR substrate-binding domain-containing protein [Bacteroidota bacterium]
MELRQLRYLLAVAEEGSITRAAERVYVTQPALSQQLQLLERELGVALLDRSGRRVRLTPAGELLVRGARRALRELEEARSAIRELVGLERGELAVGAVQTVNAYLIPSALARFWTRHPKVRLRVRELSADEIERAVIDGQLDLGLSFVPPHLAGLEVEPLFVEELVLFVRPGHPLAGRAQVRLCELDGVPLALLPPSFCTRRLWDRCAAEADLKPVVAAELNTIDGLLRLAHRVDLATALPQLARHNPLAEGLRTVRLVDPTPRRTVGGLFRKGRYVCAISASFWRMLREEVQAWASGEGAAGVCPALNAVCP